MKWEYQHVTDDDFAEDLDGFKSLRKAYDKSKDELKAIREELEKFRKKETRATLEDALKAKGLNPLAAEFYHDEDTSEAALTRFVEKFGSLLPGNGAGVQEGERPGGQEGTPVPQEVQDAQSRMAQVGQVATPPSNVSLLEAMDKAESPDELRKLIAAQPKGTA